METAFLQWLLPQLKSHPRMAIGPGDDAAVLRWQTGRGVVVTCDTLTDGVDFELEKCDPRLVGRKALAVNLSDLAAMAARPVAAFVSIVAPREGGLELTKRIYEGLLPLAEEFDLAIAGGDTNTWDGRFVIGITAIGKEHPRGSLTRSGAKPGDVILVTGEFGGSILGRHFSCVPRVREAVYLRDNFELHAATDVSDGLSLDLWHIAQSSGCGAVIETARVPVAEAARQLSLRGSGKSPLEHALSDGEDFELILAVPPQEADRICSDPSLLVPVTRIGRFVESPGLWLADADDRQQPLEPRGWQH